VRQTSETNCRIALYSVYLRGPTKQESAACQLIVCGRLHSWGPITNKVTQASPSPSPSVHIQQPAIKPRPKQLKTTQAELHPVDIGVEYSGIDGKLTAWVRVWSLHQYAIQYKRQGLNPPQAQAQRAVFGSWGFTQPIHTDLHMYQVLYTSVQAGYGQGKWQSTAF
jgi:hypothetical protein